MVVVLGLVLAACPCASALNPSLDINQYAHTAWTLREGFSKGFIRSIAQTPDGYLWLGTEFGLLRFDGVRTVPWQPPPDQHLPSDNIWSLLAARDGTLWIGTSKGLASWKDGKLAHYAELNGQFIVTLLEDHEGTVWAGGFAIPVGRLCAIRSGKAQCYGEDGRFGHWVESLYEDRGGNLWAGAKTGLWRWKPGPPKDYPLPDQVFTPQALIEGDKGALLIATNGGLRQLVNGSAEPYPLRGAGLSFKPLHLLQDQNGGLWIGTYDRGLLHVHEGRTDVFGQSDGLSGDATLALFEDREGSIWVATANGLDRFREFAVPTVSVKQGLPSAIVSSVLAAEDGSVWFGTPNGLARWNSGEVTIYGKRNAQAVTGGGKRQQEPAAAITDSGLHGAVQSLGQDNQGRIWISTRRGVGYFENGRFRQLNGMPGGEFYSITRDRAGSLWISNEDVGLFHLIGRRVVERVSWDRLVRKDSASVLAADPVQGGLWIGFLHGGVAYFKDGRVCASYTAADGLGEGNVRGLHLDRDSTLWAATEGGLSRVKNGRVATLTSQNGLPCNAAHWVMEDDAHSLWVYMACGLIRIDRSELDAWAARVDKEIDRVPKYTTQVTVFDSSDGVRSHAALGGYNPHAGKSADGRLWFLPLDGVSVVDPQHLPFNKLPPPVHIEQITADRKLRWQNLWGTAASNLRLPALSRDLEIDYTALSFVAPEKIRFRVKLEGRDPDWKDVGNERKAFYNDLPPRNYRFRAMASNNSGVWNETGDFLDFSIAPAYYQTTWFLLSCVGAFFALLWMLYRYRLYQVAREFNAHMEGRINERVRVARDLHDTLLQAFQGLMLRLQVVDEMLPPGKAKQELEETLETGDQAIVEGRNAVHDLRSPTANMNDLVGALRALGQELATGHSANFRLVIEGPRRELHPIIRDEIYRIAREALRNAFAHSGAGHIEAEIGFGERLFRLRIRDDGAGIPPGVLDGGRSGHFGLAGMRERAKQIGSQLTISSGPEAGTEMELSVKGSIAYNKTARTPGWRLFRRRTG
jgi:signal transduction histidine kinase/ligand-binding sensor domain-containing protein